MLGRDEVARVAALARLELTSDEMSRFETQLGAILEYVEQIAEVDTTGVPETTSVAAPAGERPDTPQPSLSRADALANAPDAALESGLFKVPRVLR